MKLIVLALSVFIIGNCNSSTNKINSKLSDKNSDIKNIITKDIQELSIELMFQKIDDSVNYIACPLNTYNSIIPLYIGSQGETQKQFSEWISFEPENFDLNHISILNNSVDNKTYQLFHSNAIWLDKKYSFKEDYIEKVNSQLKYKIENRDFTNRELLADEVNAFIKNKTNGNIGQLLYPDDLVNSRMIIANTIYFNAKWFESFNKKESFKGSFNVKNNHVIDIGFIKKKGKFNYYENEYYQTIEVAYSDSIASLFVLLPRENISIKQMLKEYSRIPDSDNKHMNSQNVLLSMPKLELSQVSEIQPILSGIGIKDAFNEKADFSNITGNTELYVDKIKEAVFFQVNEEGTEASAASTVVVKEKSAGLIKSININKPYIFFIKENKTDLILFSGVIFNPAQN